MSGKSTAIMGVISALTLPMSTRGGIMLTQRSTLIHTRIGMVIINALWQWLKDLDTVNKDPAAVASGAQTENLSLVVKSITPPTKELQASGSSVEAQVLKLQLVELLILCRPELIPGVQWIDVTLATGVDPGELVREYLEECMTQILCYIKVGLHLRIYLVEEDRI